MSIENETVGATVSVVSEVELREMVTRLEALWYEVARMDDEWMGTQMVWVRREHARKEAGLPLPEGVEMRFDTDAVASEEEWRELEAKRDAVRARVGEDWFCCPLDSLRQVIDAMKTFLRSWEEDRALLNAG